MKQVTFTLNGASTLMQHALNLMNPDYPKFAEYQRLSGQKKKTEATLQQLRDMEFLHGVYTDEKTGAVRVPTEAIHRCLIQSATAWRMGTTMKGAMFFLEPWAELEYSGPKSMAERAKNTKYRDYRPVRIGTSRIMRCRPIFNDWKVTAVAFVDDESVSKMRLQEIADRAGKMGGLGDFRPQYGRFNAELTFHE